MTKSFSAVESPRQSGVLEKDVLEAQVTKQQMQDVLENVISLKQDILNKKVLLEQELKNAEVIHHD